VLQAGGEKLKGVAVYEDWQGHFYDHDGAKVEASPSP
jgi:hypothetical protein